MSEILSQDEIDQLLTAISSGDKEDDNSRCISSRKIKIYDFKRPDKFSKENLRTLGMGFDVFARLMKKFLDEYTKKDCHIHVASIDQLTFEEFLRSIPVPSHLSLANANKLPFVFEADPALVFSMLGLYITEDKVMEKNRPLLENEIKAWTKDFINPMYKILKKTIETEFNVHTGKIVSNKYECNTSYVNSIPQGDMVCLITLFCKIGNDEGTMNFCLSKELAKYLCNCYNGYVESKEKEKELNENLFNQTKVPVEVVLGRTEKSILDVKGMGEGTIIELDKLAGEPVDIRINGTVLAKGEVVVIDENFGVRITEML